MSIQDIYRGAKEVARLAASGFTDEENAKTRLNICKECPDFVAEWIGGEYNSETKSYGVWTEKQQCKHCGCIMQWKVKFNGASCPLQKW